MGALPPGATASSTVGKRRSALGGMDGGDDGSNFFEDYSSEGQPGSEGSAFEISEAEAKERENQRIAMEQMAAKAATEAAAKAEADAKAEAERIRLLQPPDLTNETMQKAIMAAKVRAKSGMGRKSTFLTRNGSSTVLGGNE